VLRANLKLKLISRLVGSSLVLLLAIGMTGCNSLAERLNQQAINPNLSVFATRDAALAKTEGTLSEVNTPTSISKLALSLEKFQPQVQILSPKSDEILMDDRVTIRLDLSDLPLFKQPELGLGNHLHVILDKQTYQGVYDLTKPLVFENLAVGTHTLRVFASRPWHESFKNAGAYAQVTFHVLTKTADNHPDPQQPLLTYSRPAGVYGAEPIMLDYYLTNAPSHPTTPESLDRLADWRIRVTVNEQRFILDRWAPIYLRGFKPGKNLVRLELLDDQGQPIPNVYNDNFGIVTYDPRNRDSLAKLVRGELAPNIAQRLVDPDYVEIKPESIRSPAPVDHLIAPPIPSLQPTQPAQVSPPPVTTKIPAPTISPIEPLPVPAPIVILPIPTAQPAVKPIPIPIESAPISKTLPIPIPVQSLPSVPPMANPINSVPESITKISPLPVPVKPELTVTNPPLVSKPEPIVTASPNPIIPTTQPNELPSTPVPKTSIKPIVQPPIAPLPVLTAPISTTPIPVVSKPTTPAIEQPLPVTKTAPIADPIPEAIKSPTIQPRDISIDPNHQAVARSTQLPGGTLTPNTAPQIAAPAISPIAPAPEIVRPIASKAEKTWQTQAIEILNFTRAKIRVFTNTIPAKAQKFGINVQIWAGYAKDYATDRLQEWRNRGN
jgi:hypothetical protein